MLFVALHAAKRNLLKAIQVARYRGVTVSDAHHFVRELLLAFQRYHDIFSLIPIRYCY